MSKARVTARLQEKEQKLRPRSTPKQARSRERVDHILDITEQLVSEFGYETVTAQKISAVTEVSPGVLYHYFPGKYGIFAAVVHRAFIRLEAMMREIGEGTAGESYPEYVDTVIDALGRHFKRNRSAILLWQALEHTPQMESITSELTTIAIERNMRTIRHHFPGLPEPLVAIKARTMKAISFELLRESLFLPPKQARAILDELKALLLALPGEAAHAALPQERTA
jgi:AcrR family transcriptional regulator